MGACKINWLILNDFTEIGYTFRLLQYLILYNAANFAVYFVLLKDKFRSDLFIKRAHLYLAG
jgi:hypothetical protein